MVGGLLRGGGLLVFGRGLEGMLEFDEFGVV